MEEGFDLAGFVILFGEDGLGDLFEGGAEGVEGEFGGEVDALGEGGLIEGFGGLAPGHLVAGGSGVSDR